MLKIRLSRTGKKKQASYRVVVADKDSKRDGRIVERIGYYNPLPNPAEYRIKEERALYWLSVGAQPTDAVRILLEKQGTYGRLARLNAGETLETLVAEFGGTPPVAETVVAPAAPFVVETAEQPVEEPAEVELAAEEVAETEVVEETAEDSVVEEVEVVEAEETAAEPEMVEAEDTAEEPEMVEAEDTAEAAEMAETEETAEAPEMTEAEDTAIEPEVAEAEENE
jgi:small subunit ribosomal protein S16